MNSTNETNGGDSELPANESTTESIHSDYDQTEVRILDTDGNRLGAVTAAIADDVSLRYTGLSETESLPTDRGMLFVYNSEGEHTFVMRRMDFPIDIVYVDAEKTITKIHHAEAPGPGEDGESKQFQFPGRGQYVLEVNYDWTTERGIEVGDKLSFSL